MPIRVTVDGTTPAEWGSLAAAFADHNLYQTWHFGACRAAEMHAEVSRLIVRRDDAVIGLAQARIKRLPVIGAGVAHVLFGPLWRRPDAMPADLQVVLEAVRDEYATRRGLNLQIVPNLPEADMPGDAADTFAAAGFERDPLVESYRTFRLDLTPPLEELRKGLAQKWRNGLNQAERNRASVVASSDPSAMAAFESLYVEMKARKAFETDVSIELFRTLQDTLPAAERPLVLLATVDDQPVAGHVSSTLGDTSLYLLGASNETGRTHKAAYLLQWQAIVRARELGKRWYDLGGIDPAANPGSHHFKAGVGGQECRYVGQYCAAGGCASRCLTPLAARVYRAVKRVHT
jgi:lipid II:glycine glycyltransferase (peptidoglycan interpeptide bridge formation enzyme)